MESVTGFNKLLEEFILVILALLVVKKFNLTAVFPRGRKTCPKGSTCQGGLTVKLRSSQNRPETGSLKRVPGIGVGGRVGDRATKGRGKALHRNLVYSETRLTSLVILNTVELDLAPSDPELLLYTSEMSFPATTCGQFHRLLLYCDTAVCD